MLRRIGRLPREKALDDRAPALRRARRPRTTRGVLHRDLKPANIMLDGRGRVRIMDFGLAMRIAGESGAQRSRGTPASWRRSSSRVGSRPSAADIYALGLVLYEIFTGSRVFEVRTFEDARGCSSIRARCCFATGSIQRRPP